ncbi:MAG TPA: proton-conducting transporter membrane subunit [Candidatus Eisenbacteria bacterium]
MVAMVGSGIALAVLGVPLAGALATWVLPRPARKGAWVATSALALGLAALQAVRVAGGASLAALGDEVLVDGLGAVMALLITFMALACSVFGLAYLPGTHARDPEHRERLERRLPVFISLFQVLEFTLLWVVMTNNLVLLWVALEATTLASALLVAFYWDPRALEAGYKYLLLLTVGITSALFGCVLLYAAAAPLLGSESALLISNLARVADRIPAHLVLTANLLLLVGFGTKAGLAPFHPWVADAHAEAPAMMSAFLSSVIIKVPLVGMLRIWSVFAPRHPELDQLLLGVGLFTMVLGAALAAGQDDLKRLHAYSSVSQVGFIAAAMGLGPPLGIYAAVFFLVSHALTKGLLFLTAGAVVFATPEIRSLAALGGLQKRMPLTAACALVGALSLAGLPPFSGFVAKVQVLFAAAASGAWIPLALAVGVSLVTMAYMTSMVQRVFRGLPRSAALAGGAVHEVPAAMLWGMGLLAAAVLALGLQPQWLDPLLRQVGGP